MKKLVAMVITLIAFFVFIWRCRRWFKQEDYWEKMFSSSDKLLESLRLLEKLYSDSRNPDRDKVASIIRSWDVLKRDTDKAHLKVPSEFMDLHQKWLWLFQYLMLLEVHLCEYGDWEKAKEGISNAIMLIEGFREEL